MATRTKVLVVDSDIDTLSRIYLALVHRNYKAEATDKVEETVERIKRLKPSVVIVGLKEYADLKDVLKTPAILLIEHQHKGMELPGDVVALEKPFTIEVLIRMIESLVI